MTEQTAPEQKKPKRQDAIVATITIALPVDKKAVDLFKRGAAMQEVVDAVLEALRNEKFEGLSSSVDGPKLGKLDAGVTP